MLRRRNESRMTRVWRGDWVKSRVPHTLALKLLMFLILINLISTQILLLSLRNLLSTSDSTRKLIPIYFQNIIQNLMLFPNVKRSTVTFIFLFLVSKFHFLVKYPCNIRFCCAIILTEWIVKYQSECDAIL